MNRILLALLLLGAVALGTTPLWADDDNHEHKKFTVGQGDPHNLKPVDNEIYQAECGSCHLAYQPGLLNRDSWKALMSDLAHHFGDDATLEPEAQNQVEAYLSENAADAIQGFYVKKAAAEAGKPLLRFSESSYFKREHHGIKPQVLARPAIRSWAHCEACHKAADRGVYEEDYTKIPL